MPQAERKPTKAVDSLSDSNPRELNKNQTMEKRSDGSYWLVEQLEQMGDKKTGPDRKERRCDSAADVVHVANGGTLWYIKLYDDQNAAAAKAEAKAKAAAAAKAAADAKKETKPAPKPSTKGSK